MPQALRTEPHQSIDTLTSMPITLNISDDIVRRLEVAAQLRSVTLEELAVQVLTDNTPHITQNPQQRRMSFIGIGASEQGITHRIADILADGFGH
jgi:hypothetical protein